MGFLGQGKFSRLDPRFIYFQKEELTFYEFIDIGFRSQVFSVIAIKFYLFRYSCMTSSLNKWEGFSCNISRMFLRNSNSTGK